MIQIFLFYFVLGMISIFHGIISLLQRNAYTYGIRSSDYQIAFTTALNDFVMIRPGTNIQTTDVVVPLHYSILNPQDVIESQSDTYSDDIYPKSLSQVHHGFRLMILMYPFIRYYVL
jgi:hypothetical protein